MKNLRSRLKELLKKHGLQPAARFLVDPFLYWEPRRQFQQFSRRYGDVLRYSLNSAENKNRRALIVNSGFHEGVGLGLIKALELAGFEPIVLLQREQRFFVKYYNLAAIKEVIFWNEFNNIPNLAAAEAVIDRCRSFDELLEFEYAGARVGRFATSTALRQLRLASQDLRSAQDRQILAKYVALSMTASTEAQRILQEVHPELLLVSGPVYTPDGELFDICLANGIDVIASENAHKSNTLLFKRYTPEIRDEHFASLSSESWRFLCGMQWTDAHREQLQREVHNTYTRGDWYPVLWGISSGERLLGADEIRTRLGLDPAKKTALIFPHILWDASFSWGKNLFENYEEWFIQAVRVACMNDQINWVIKIHPANVGKNVQDGFHGEPAEVIALHKHIGTLPPHVFFIPADSDISTFSLFGLMDYCLTVRGTVGIEAASFGVPVLTAGTGRYDRRGFTIDSDSREEYFDRLAHLQEIPRLSPAQRELAERFAYGLFVLRPLPLQTVTIGYHKDRSPEKGFNKIQISIRTKEDWYNAPDLRALAHWLNASKQTDFMMPLLGEELISNLNGHSHG